MYTYGTWVRIDKHNDQTFLSFTNTCKLIRTETVHISTNKACPRINHIQQYLNEIKDHLIHIQCEITVKNISSVGKPLQKILLEFMKKFINLHILNMIIWLFLQNIVYVFFCIHVYVNMRGWKPDSMGIIVYCLSCKILLT